MTTPRIVLLFALLGPIAFAADPKVPDSFLRVPEKLVKIIERPVSGTFRETPSLEVVDALCRQLQVNCAYHTQEGQGSSRPVPPTFTGSFKDTPFRTALYQVAQATHMKVSLVDPGDGHRYLSFEQQ